MRAFRVWRTEKWLGCYAGPWIIVVYLSLFWTWPGSRWFWTSCEHVWTFRLGPLQVSYDRYRKGGCQPPPPGRK